MEIGTHSQVPFLHLLRAISGTPVNAILRNPAGPQKEKDKAAPRGAHSAGTGTFRVTILICILFA